MSGVTFEWSGNNVIVRRLNGNYIMTVRNARDAYHSGSDVVVIGSSYETITFDAHGFKHVG